MKKICITLLTAIVSLAGHAQKFAYGTGTDLWGGSPSEADYKEAKALGFDYIELAPGAYGGGNYDQIVSGSQSTLTKLKNAGVTVWSIHLPYGDYNDISVLDESTRNQTIARLKDYIKALADVFSPEVMVLHPSSEPIPDSEREQRIVNSAASVAELYQTACEAGVTLCVENLPRTCLGNTPEELLRIVEPTPGVKICFDTNHFLKGSTEHFIRTAGHLIGTVHVSDFDYNDEKHWLPKLGKIAWGELMLQLEEAGYDGVFMSESERTLDGKATIQQMKETYDAIFDEYDELKADPAKRLGAYLDGIRKQYFEDSEISDVFPAGDAPGFYPQEAYDAFCATWEAGLKAVGDNLTADEYAALRAEARESIEALVASVNPVANGYYYIVSGHSGFAERNKTMAMYADESALLKWEAWHAELKYLFEIKQLENGLFSIQNCATDRYVNTVAGTSQNVPTTERHITDQIINSLGKMGQFTICNTENSIAYHTMSHLEGEGDGSNIVTWNGAAGSGSSWYFRPVDDETVAELMKDKASAASRLAEFIGEFNALYFSDDAIEDVLAIGTEPGFFNAEDVEAFMTVYNNTIEASRSDITHEDYLDYRLGLEEAFETLKSAANPVVDGYYWLKSGHFGFKEAGKDIACYSDGSMTLKWKAFAEELPFLFHITVQSDGTCSILNMGNEAYVNTVGGYSNPIPMSATQQTSQIVEPFGRYGMVSICNTESAIHYHTAGHSEGAGSEGDVVTWPGVPGSGSSWFLRPVPSETVDRLTGSSSIVEIIPADSASGAVYTISGKRVNAVRGSLPAGIYIIDGQKAVINGR